MGQGVVEGCTPISEACDNCWAAAATAMRSNQLNFKMKSRYGGLTNQMGYFNGRTRMMWDDISKPASVKKPQIWAIWNDLFHENVGMFNGNRFLDTVFSAQTGWPTTLMPAKGNGI